MSARWPLAAHMLASAAAAGVSIPVSRDDLGAMWQAQSRTNAAYRAMAVAAEGTEEAVGELRVARDKVARWHVHTANEEHHYRETLEDQLQLASTNAAYQAMVVAAEGTESAVGELRVARDKVARWHTATKNTDGRATLSDGTTVRLRSIRSRSIHNVDGTVTLSDGVVLYPVATDRKGPPPAIPLPQVEVKAEPAVGGGSEETSELPVRDIDCSIPSQKRRRRSFVFQGAADALRARGDEFHWCLQ